MTTTADEARQEPGSGSGWSDAWYVDFASEDGVGGFLRVALHPERGRAWVWAALVSPERTVLVRDHEVPVPAQGLELRSTGLWCDLTCETPFAHWSLGLEAFGVGLDDPLDAWGDERGERVPLGFDLEWEALAPPFEHPQPAGRTHTGHVQHPGRVHGEILVGDETIAFDGTGERDRHWGALDWWTIGWHWSAFRVGDALAVSVARPDRPGEEHAIGYVAVDGEEAHPLVRAGIETDWGDGGLPAGARYKLETGLVADVEVVAPVPLLIPDEGGARTSRLARALCRFHTGEGEGLGWAEWLRV